MKKLLLLLAGCLIAGSTAFAQTESETPTAATPEAIHAGTDDLYISGTSNNLYAGFPKVGTAGEKVYVYFNAYDGNECKGIERYNASLATVNYIASAAIENPFEYEKSTSGNSINIATVTYTTTGNASTNSAGNVTFAAAEDFSVFIPESGRTFITPLELKIPAGVKVYLFEDYSDGTITFREAYGTVPAYTPVFLKVETADTYTFEFNGENSNLFGGKWQFPKASNRTYLYDQKVGDLFYGVLSPHLLPANSYVFNGMDFALQTDVTNMVIDPFYCYINLPVANDSLESISVVLKNAKEGYYLGGKLTEEFDDDPNPSYMFTESDGTYTLEVASIPAGITFYVIYCDANGNLSYYGSNKSADTDLQPNNFITLYEGTPGDNGEFYSIGLGSAEGTPAGYLNVTFTLTLDGTDNVIPSSLSYTGTLNKDIEGMVVTVTNDKTNQSGSVDESEIKLYTLNDAAVIYVYSSSQVYYALENVKDIVEETVTENSPVAVDEEDDYTEAAYNATAGAYTISLETGTTGTISLKNDESSTPVSYSYAVYRTAPTAVDGIQAEQEDGVIYNVFGQRVDESYKGIVIRNGKKYIQR